MIAPEAFLGALGKDGPPFLTGVPDSLLKDFLACIDATVPAERHVIAANEGNAIALAAGYHLATGRAGIVYLQNSGLGNALNPLASLADPEVYAIPMLLVVGWRGEPGVKDEPQHVKQGKITEDLLRVLGIPFAALSPDMTPQALSDAASGMLARSLRESRPTALLVRNGVFENFKAAKAARDLSAMTRERAIEVVAGAIEPDAIVVSTTGKISRELYEIRKRRGEPSRDFLVVGSMGHASQIALGIALHGKARPVYCLDGDGAAIMHLGALATAGWLAPQNFRHVVLNNGAHDSVGGQTSAAGAIDLTGIAKSCGYKFVGRVADEKSLETQLSALRSAPGPGFLEVLVNLQSRKDLGRPKESTHDNKAAFQRFVRG